jgi:hypothetical protein
MKTNEIQREGRKKDKLERELRQTKAELDTRLAETKLLQQNLERNTNDAAKLNEQIKEQKVSLLSLGTCRWNVGQFFLLLNSLRFWDSSRHFLARNLICCSS